LSLLSTGRASDSLGSGLPCTDANDLLEVADKYLAVADFAGACGVYDRLDYLLDDICGHGHLDLCLGQKIDDILGAAIQLGVTKPLTSVTVIPCMPISATAWRTSSSLKGLMIAVISFINVYSLSFSSG
jgi:hypothetical protein